MYEKCYCYLIKQLQNSRSGVPITFGIKTKNQVRKAIQLTSYHKIQEVASNVAITEKKGKH